MRPYELADVVKALEGVAPCDWNRFFAERVYAVAPHGPPNPLLKAYESVFKIADLSRSLGLVLKSEDGTIVDVYPGSPADLAGLAPAAKVVAVDGRRFKAERLDVMFESAKAKHQVEVLVENAEVFQSLSLAYPGGKRTPVLVRNEKVPDVLAGIVAAGTK